jgi:hypothetical protein
MSTFSADIARLASTTLSDVADLLEGLSSAYKIENSGASGSLTVSDTAAHELFSAVVPVEADDLLLTITTLPISASVISTVWNLTHACSIGTVLNANHAASFISTVISSTGKQITVPIITLTSFSAAGNCTVGTYANNETGSGTLYWRRYNQLMLKLKNKGSV